jgi:hypothetical protein
VSFRGQSECHSPLRPAHALRYAQHGGGGRCREEENAPAPKGNLNALKHGERSKQFARLGATIAASPKARVLLLRYADRFDAEQRKADELAGRVVEQIISRGLIRGRDRLILLPDLLDEERTITQTSPNRPLLEPAPTLIPENTPSDNQSPNTNNHNQSENTEGNPNDCLL